MAFHKLEDTQKSDRRALGWFALGAVLGVIITLAVSAINASPTAGRDVSQQPSIDYQQVREAAREGAAQALREANSTNPTIAQSATATPQAVAVVQPRPRSSLGSDQAQVVIVEFSDFECGYCRLFYERTLPQLREEYINSGKVRFSYRHFPILADSSLTKAEAAECAGEQERFWEYHNALFSGKVSGQGNQADLKQALVRLAGEMNMDTARFEACLNEGRYRNQVMEDYQVARSAGVQGTPTFFVNGKLLVGAQPMLAFRNEIEAALRGQSR
ncbi:MAG: DsbA family protein [Thermoflexales bacterium]